MQKFFSILLLAFFTLISNFSFAQNAYLGNELFKQINEPNADAKFYEVDIMLKNQFNIDSLLNYFENNKIPLEVRAKQTNELLQNHAEKSQANLFNYLKNYQEEFPNQILSFEPYYIINVIILKAKPSLIKKLLNRPEIAYIELDLDHFLQVDEVRCLGETPPSPNGKENGLSAINADKMWSLGYTGKGTIGMVIDDGTHGLHPALRNNFRGNFFRLSESWHSTNGAFPSCFTSSSHGTHVTGTMCGLSPSNNDTIGVAFNAHWTGSAAISSGCGAPNTIASFQWALNPDGNTSTNSDIPDVINCSFSSTAGGAGVAQCTGQFVGILSANEAAGTAIVISAGNSGPGTSTVTEPADINLSVVNTFAVGNLNANTPSFPIANSSSRGPSVCGKSGSLLIKPEVSAPGENVRSATGTSTFGLLSGTSMAAPHASGAVLLLKEAFPNLSGTAIKMALYNSARDLGVAGEDNQYGMGIIDVFAAYNLLAMSNTPVTPTSSNRDIAIEKIDYPENLICGTFTPTVTIANKGSVSITNARIQYRLDNGATQTQNWSGVLAPNQTTSVTLGSLTTAAVGNHSLFVRVDYPTSTVEIDDFNNQKYAEFRLLKTKQTLFEENFEISVLFAQDWLVNDLDFQNGWQIALTTGLAGSFRSVKMDLFNYTPRAKQVDELIAPIIQIPASGDLFLDFKVAYRQRVPISNDSLKVLISTDCGISFTQVFTKSGADLATGNFQVTNFSPSQASDWRGEHINLSQFIGMDKMIVKFVSVNDNGNNLYLDKVQIYSSLNPGIAQLENTKIKVYPNPAQEKIIVEFESDKIQKGEIVLLNLLGEKIKTFPFANQRIGKNILDVNDLESGLYLVQFCNESGCRSFKIAVD